MATISLTLTGSGQEDQWRSNGLIGGEGGGGSAGDPEARSAWQDKFEKQRLVRSAPQPGLCLWAITEHSSGRIGAPEGRARVARPDRYLMFYIG